MKKTTKIALIVAGVLLVIGLILCGIAVYGVNYDVEKLSKSATPRSDSFDASQITEVQIHVKTESVEVTRSKNDQISLAWYDREGWTYTVTNEDGILTLEQKTVRKSWLHWISFDLFTPNTDIQLQLPEGFTGNLSIVTDVGDMDLEKITINGNVNCQTDTGSIDVDRLTATALSIQSDIGDVDGDNLVIENDMQVLSQTGGIYVEVASIGGELLVQSDIGSMSLDHVKAKTTDLSTQTGSIKLELFIAEQIYCKTDIGDIKGSIAGNEADYTVLTSTEIGSSNLKDRVSTTDRLLDATTKTGGIDLRFVS